jgi:hypothetical protein
MTSRHDHERDHRSNNDDRGSGGYVGDRNDKMPNRSHNDEGREKRHHSNYTDMEDHQGGRKDLSSSLSSSQQHQQEDQQQHSRRRGYSIERVSDKSQRMRQGDFSQLSIFT